MVAAASSPQGGGTAGWRQRVLVSNTGGALCRLRRDRLRQLHAEHRLLSRRFSLTVGVYGTGLFTQNGGTHQVANLATIGQYAGGSGTYSLSGGSLSHGGEISSSATPAARSFVQSREEPTRSRGGSLVLAVASSSNGIYNLNGGLRTSVGGQGIAQARAGANFNLGGGTLGNWPRGPRR